MPLLEAMAADVPCWPFRRRRCRTRLAARACSLRRRISSTPRRSSASLPLTRRYGLRSLRGSGGGWPTQRSAHSQRARKADIVKIAFIVDATAPRSRRLRVSLPADCRTSRGQARRRGVDDVRAGLHHLGERLSRGQRPDPRRDGAPLQERAHRATSRRSISIRTGSSTTRTRETTNVVARTARPVVPGAD